MLPNEIDNAPAAVTLLGVLEGKGRHFGSEEAATQEHGDDCPVPQPLFRRDVRRVQQPLGLPHRKPVHGSIQRAVESSESSTRDWA